MKVREVATDRAGVDVPEPGRRIAAAGVVRELDEIGPVASERVRRGVLLEREVTKKCA
jgi:hypothetical protein